MSIEISVVSPVYKAEAIVDRLVEELCHTLDALKLSYELILVEDGSPDGSWEGIQRNCERFPQVKGVKLSRNFGQHFALSAGLEATTGNYVVVMDCDLQDHPRYISEMYALAQQGFDIVYTKKQQRKHGFWKNFQAQVFFAIFNYLADNQHAEAATGNFSMLSRKVVEAFAKVKDAHRHYLMVLRWLGFSHTFLEVEHEKRYAGKSSYTWRKLVRHALDGITSQSDKLLRFSIGIGFSFFVFSMAYAGYALWKYFVAGALAGWTSTIVILSLATGLILMAIGVLGIYIGKIFEQVKDRPLYIIDKTLNL